MGAAGYPLGHGNPLSRTSGGDSGHRRPRGEQDVPRARGAPAHAQGARAHPRRRTRYQTFKALNDVSFAIESGEFFGIAGRNGSGKSTLLKCLAGIYGADGQIWRRGRLSTLIELGVGFSMDMAAKDNVVMNGIMLGLSPREARKRFDSVIEFAELQEFKDLKLKNYSSGMQVRLAFSVAIQVDAEILMVDEVLAVGDASFQQKCFDVFNDLRDRGRRSCSSLTTWARCSGSVTERCCSSAAIRCTWATRRRWRTAISSSTSVGIRGRWEPGGGARW